MEEALSKAAGNHGGGAFLGACRYRPGSRAALQGWADHRPAPGAHLRGDRISQSAAGCGLHGGCDDCRSGNLYLRQPVGRTGAGAIFRIKEAVPLAALPATRTEQVLEAINPAYPQFIDGVNVLHTGLNNMGAIFHPALTLLNCRLDRSDARRLPVLHRWCHAHRWHACWKCWTASG